ncbi:MAG: response regulator [Proteobacteria bacterium]|nr:response regulator [Pseudomonadota bacterium]
MSAAAPARHPRAYAPELARRPDGQPRRVLYAEDQVSSRVVTKAMLEKMGFQVDAVDDGELAVEKAASGSYDLVLLDIEMPVMDGVTAARIIRAENENYRATPILALSAFLADSTENCIWRDAFDTAVPKPANMQDISLAMLRAMEKHGVAPKMAEPKPQPNLTAGDGSLWSSMEKTLPRGTRALLVRAAAGEMEHLALAVAAAREAGETEQLRKCRHTLKGLALNFGLDEVVSAIASTSTSPRTIDMSALLTLIRSWLEKNGKA